MRHRIAIVSLLAGACAGRSAGAHPPDLQAAVGTSGLAERCVPPKDWPLWEAYLARFVQPDGRVVDHTGGGHSTSEGQGYALFHALVADDRATFERVLGWMQDNLAQGDLAQHLPAWKWGMDDQGRWRVLDENAASDADLWTAYALREAGRLWREPRWVTLGDAVLRQVAAHEVADLPGLGPTLLPGPVGFQLDPTTWRLNPSYVPIQVLRSLATSGAPGPWEEVLASSVRMLRDASGHGLMADWVGYRAGEGFTVDPVSGPVGSYDAIRVYLWAGMLHDDDPAKATVATSLDGLLRYWRAHGHVPEEVNPLLDVGLEREGPVGFTAVLLPEVAAMDREDELTRLRAQIEAQADGQGLYGAHPNYLSTYYDSNLLLFARGFVDGRYRFGPDGHLNLRWSERCDGSGG